MNFLDLVQNSAPAGEAGPGASGNGEKPAEAIPSGPAGLIEIDQEEFARQQRELQEAQRILKEAKEAERAAQQPAASAKGPSVSTHDAGRNPGEQISFGEDAGAYLLSFRGEFDETNVDAEFDKIEGFMGDLRLKLAVFDFSEVTYVNSKTMGYLASWYQRFLDAGGELSIAHGGAVSDSLDACGITQLMPIVPTVAEALADLRLKFPQHVPAEARAAHADAAEAPKAETSVPAAATEAPKAEAVAAAPAAPAAAQPESSAAAAMIAAFSAEEPASATPAPGMPAGVSRIEEVGRITSPSGIRDSEGRTLIFYEKKVSPVMQASDSGKGDSAVSAPVSAADGHDAEAFFAAAEADLAAKLQAAAEEQSRKDEEKAAKMKAMAEAAIPQQARAAQVQPAAAPAAKPAAVPAAPARSRKFRKLAIGAALATAAAAAGLQFSGSPVLADLVSGIELLVSPRAEVVPEAPKRAEPVRRARPRPRPASLAATGATSAGGAMSGATSTGAAAPVKKVPATKK